MTTTALSPGRRSRRLPTRATLLALAFAVLAAVTVGFDVAARAGRLDSDYWILAFWALGLCWIVAIAYGVTLMLRQLGFARGVAALAAATALLLILWVADLDDSGVWSLGWSAALLGWVVALVYGFLRLLARGRRHVGGRSELVR